MSAAAAPAPPGISVCSAPTCQPIAACTIGADVGSWKEVERVFKEADSVNKRMKAGSRMQRHAQPLHASLQPCHASRCAMDIHRMM